MAPPGSTAPAEPVDGLKRELAGVPASQRGAADLIPLLVVLTQTARREGLVGLEPVEKKLDDDLLTLGLRMVIDGANRDIVKDTLQARKATLILSYERRQEMVISAVLGIGEGMNPRVLDERCRAFL